MANDRMRRAMVIVGIVLVLAGLSYVASVTVFGSPPTGLLLAAAPTPTTTLPPPTVTPTPKPTEPPPTATPQPTVGYIDVTSSQPEASTTPASRAKKKLWQPQERALMIDQNTQTMSVYENGRKIRTIPVSTGKPIMDHFTPTWIGRVGPLYGTFFSFGTYADNGWQLFKAGGNILIHGAPYVFVNGKKVYQDLDSLGHYPSSHGCIRVHPSDADWLTAWNLEGVPVILMPWRGGLSE